MIIISPAAVFLPQIGQYSFPVLEDFRIFDLQCSHIFISPCMERLSPSLRTPYYELLLAFRLSFTAQLKGI